MYAVRDARKELGPAFLPLPALVIPYPDPFTGDLIQYADDSGVESDFFRVRYLAKPEPGKGWAGGKMQRYAQPPRSGVHPYFPALDDLDWTKVIEDPREPIIITEGEKKALRACLAGYNCIGLGGVYNFLSMHELIPILDRVPWLRRKLYVCYDSDSAQNTDIQAAEARLAGELIKRGAQVRIMRLPEGEQGDKIGIDDFLEEQGEAAFSNLLNYTDMSGRVGRVEQKVLELNERLAWIESRGALLDLRKEVWVSKDNFTRGSEFSALSVTVPAPRAADGVKEVQVAPKFLTSALSRRYDDAICDPSTTEREIRRDGQLIYNTFKGFDSEPGDVSDWIALTRYLFSDLEDPDFPIKVLAYKAQNPDRKVAIAFVLAGAQQGTGKSLWGKIVSLAFHPHSTASMDTKVLRSDFTAWLEDKMLVLFDEASPEDISEGSRTLKRWITEKTFLSNQKFIVAREAKNLATFIITTNDLSAGVFQDGDRRMLVVSPPDPRTDPISDRGIYKRLYRTYEDPTTKYGAHLMHFLQNYELDGWEPPERPPMSASKAMAFEESLSEVERVAWSIVQGRYTHDPVVDWCDAAMMWAQENIESRNPDDRDHAQTIMDTLPSLKIRPWYTPEELLQLLPHLRQDMKIKRSNATPAGALSALFRQAGVAYVRLKDKRRPVWRGLETTFLIVSSDPKDHAPVDQEYFDSVMRNAPRYADVMRQRKKS